MAEIVAVGSGPGDIPGGGWGATKNTANFDPDYTFEAYYTESDSSFLPIFYTGGVGENTAWLHFRYQHLGSNLNAGNGDAHAFFDDSGRMVASVRRASTAWWIAAHGDTTVMSANPFFSGAMGTGTTLTLDLSAKVDPTEITVELYLGGALVATAVADNTNSQRGKVASAQIRSMSSNRAASVSEVIATWGIPTVGFRLAQLAPDGSGFYDDMLGDWTDLAAADPGQVVAGTADGQRSSWTLSNYTGAISPGSIAALVGRVTTSRLRETGLEMNQFIRTGGMNSDAPAAENFRLDSSQAVWWVNPDSGLPWTAADLASVEHGVRTKEP